MTAVVRAERSPATGATVPIEVERWWFDSSGRLLVAVEADHGVTRRRVVRSYDAAARTVEERDETLSEGEEGAISTTTMTTTRRVERDAAGAPVRVLSTEIARDGTRRERVIAIGTKVPDREGPPEDAGAPESAEPEAAEADAVPVRDYDSKGRLLRERRRAKRVTGTLEETTIAFEYDPAGRLVTEQSVVSRAAALFGSGAPKTSTVRYLYDGACTDGVASRVAPPRRGTRDPDEGALDRLPLRAR